MINDMNKSTPSVSLVVKSLLTSMLAVSSIFPLLADAVKVALDDEFECIVLVLPLLSVVNGVVVVGAGAALFV